MTGKQLVVGVCMFLTLTGIFYSALYEKGSVSVVKWNETYVNHHNVTVREVLVNTTNCSYTQDLIIPTTELKLKRLQVNDPPRRECVTKDHIVFLKTHKTGSTTVASIFERYGLFNNFTFALPQSRHFFTPVQDLFSRRHMAQISAKYLSAFLNNSWTGYNFLTNHARYNRPEMDAVVHNAIYVTILRSPVEQFESVFGYYEMAKYVGLKTAKDPISSFMEKPQYYFNKHFTAWYWSRNAQLFDLGLEHVHHDDPYALNYKIQQLDFEFDLVLLTEFFDESLLLLRKLLCWEWNDILYFPKGVRSKSHRYEMSSDLKSKILTWNGADVKLYNHFNKTFWRKISEYGPSFENDLIYFRSKLTQLEQDCIAVNKSNTKDRREEKDVLKKDAADFCLRVYRDDVYNTKLIRDKMITEGHLVKQAPTQTIKVVKVPVAKFMPARNARKTKVQGKDPPT